MSIFQVLRDAVQPREGWGPAKPENRFGRYAADDIMQEVEKQKRRRLSNATYDNLSFMSPDSIFLRPPSYTSAVYIEEAYDTQDTTLNF